MESNLPATRDDAAIEPVEEPARGEAHRPVSVAFLPLALVAFIIIAFTIAAWTFLHAAV